MKPLSTCLLMCAAASALAAEPALRWSAPVAVSQSAAFVQLPLPASAYGRSQQPGLADLRLLDARGERVPFALLPAPAAAVQSQEQWRDTTAYPLPRRSAPGAALASPLEVLVQGDTIRVRRMGSGADNKPAADTPGWLFDLGERSRDAPAPQTLRLAWSGPAEFSAAFDVDTSANLRDWQGAGSGQVLALASATGPLQQRDVPLPPQAPRFVRLVWRDPATAPQISSAQALTLQQTPQPQDAPSELQFAPTPEAAAKQAPPAGSLHFDLGGALPVVALDLKLPPGTRVAPVRLQGRTRADEAWRELGSAVFYRIDREGASSHSPAFGLNTSLRYLRVLPDPRAGALDPAQTQLAVRAQLARLVFATQGQPPYRLLAGSAEAVSGALPITTLVPQLEDERPRLGRAELGAWAEETAVAQQAASAERQAAWRPWILWGVLLSGVAGLAAMVWKLARARPAGT